jgi:hypothetical protein
MRVLFGSATSGVALFGASLALAQGPVIDTVARPTSLVSSGSAVVWSRFEADGRYHLVGLWGGATQTVPAPASPGPIAADVDVRGLEVRVVYSQCARVEEPNAAAFPAWVNNQRCSLRLYNASTGDTKTLVQGSRNASAVLAALYHDRLLYFVIRPHPRRAVLVERKLGRRRGHELRRFRLRGHFDGPFGIDLAARGAAYVTRTAHGDNDETVLFSLRGRRTRQLAQTTSGAALKTISAPTIVGSQVYYLRSGFSSEIKNTLERIPLSGGTPTTQPGSRRFLTGAVSDGHWIVVRAPDQAGALNSCETDPPSNSSCTIEQVANA